MAGLAALTRLCQVGPEVLPLVQEYLNFHRADGRSDKVGTVFQSPA